MGKWMSPQQTKKHHYLPAFYLRRWQGGDGLLCEFSRPYRTVTVKNCTATATGFEQDLYTLNNLPPESRSFLEDDFLRHVDQLASDALAALESDNTTGLSIDILSGWSRFIISLHHRTPDNLRSLKHRSAIGLQEHLKQISDNYSEFRREGDPLTFEEARLLFDNKWTDGFLAKLFTKVVDSANIMSHINCMKWRILTVENEETRFLTSDSPIVRTTSIFRPGDFLMMPIGPTKLFLAVNDDETFQQIESNPIKRLGYVVNDHVCRRARKYVYSTDTRQLRFIGNRLTLKQDISL